MGREESSSRRRTTLSPLVHRLAYNGKVARRSPGQLAVFQGGPSRTGGKTPLFVLITGGRGPRAPRRPPDGYCMIDKGPLQKPVPTRTPLPPPPFVPTSH